MIRSLKTKMEGAIQCNLVQWRRNDLRPSNLHPLLFTLDDFTNLRPTSPTFGGAVYQTNALTGNVDIVTNWELSPQTLGNPYLEKWQEDDPGGGKYRMLSNRIVLEVEGTPSLSNTRVRVQVFSLKADAFQLATSTANIMSMPDGLIHLKHMCDYSEQSNFLPGKFFKKYLDKQIVINSEPASTSGTHPTTLNKKYISFKIAPKGGKLVTQGITYPPVQGVQPDPALVEPSGGWYGPLNRQVGQVLYCLVSTDYPYENGQVSKVSVKCSSFRKWRDLSGSYY